MTCKTTDPNCIKYIFDSCYLYLHLSRGVWVRPTKERADREHPPPKASIVNLASVITWFDIDPPGTQKFYLPDHVVSKLEDYAFCLFGSARKKSLIIDVISKEFNHFVFLDFMTPTNVANQGHHVANVITFLLSLYHHQ